DREDTDGKCEKKSTLASSQCAPRFPIRARCRYLVSLAEINVVCGVPNWVVAAVAGWGLRMMSVGSMSAMGWTEIFMLLPLPLALLTVTPAKPTMAYVAF